jgi:Zn-dependent protease with chaperone function
MWDYIKIGFKLRIFVFSIVVFGISFFGIATTPLLKSLFLLCTSPFIPIMAYITTVDSFNKAKTMILFHFKKGKEIPVPDEILSLAKEMGVKTNKFKLIPGELNAGISPNGNIFIGEDMLPLLGKQEFQAVFAHEFSHIKRKHHMKKLLATLGFLLIGYIVFFNIPSLFQAYAILGFLSIVTIPINWRFEFEADEDGKKFVGASHMASALSKITGNKNPDEASETHPPVNKRIKNLLV